MVTLGDVAQKAGVSKATVSRTLNGDPAMVTTEATREKILRAASELGYQKRARQAEPSYEIAVIHKETHYQSRADNSYYFSIRYGIESLCHSQRVKCSFVPTTMLSELPTGLDGVIINGNYPQEQLEEICRGLGETPAVMISGMNTAPAGVDLITIDVVKCVNIALDHLAERGCRTLLYVGGKDVYKGCDCGNRLKAYRAYLAGHPQLREIGEVEGEYGIESGYKMMSGWLNAGKPLPDGVFASHDPIAVGALRALAERGISVPDRVRVVGINGDEIGSITAPPLTTVSVFTEAMGAEAVRTLLERIKDKEQPAKRVSFQPGLIQRQSS